MARSRARSEKVGERRFVTLSPDLQGRLGLRVSSDSFLCYCNLRLTRLERKAGSYEERQHPGLLVRVPGAVRTTNYAKNAWEKLDVSLN